MKPLEPINQEVEAIEHTFRLARAERDMLTKENETLKIKIVILESKISHNDRIVEEILKELNKINTGEQKCLQEIV